MDILVAGGKGLGSDPPRNTTFSDKIEALAPRSTVIGVRIPGFSNLLKPGSETGGEGWGEAGETICLCYEWGGWDVQIEVFDVIRME